MVQVKEYQILKNITHLLLLMQKYCYNQFKCNVITQLNMVCQGEHIDISMKLICLLNLHSLNYSNILKYSIYLI